MPEETKEVSALLIPNIPSFDHPIANIARARPIFRSGSVTQSTNVGADGITLDQITSEKIGPSIAIKKSGKINWVATNNVFFNDNDFGSASLGQQIGVLRNQSSNVSGRFHVDKGSYLTMGSWKIYEKYDVNQDARFPENYAKNRPILEIGTFIEGNDPFNEINMPIEGEVIYNGYATILRIDNYQNHNAANWIFSDSESGDVRLIADFGNKIISGTIDNHYDHGYGNEKIPVNLNLNNAKIGSSSSGFFEGNLTGTFNDEKYNGLYGGQFYNTRIYTDYTRVDGNPKTVAGTFSGISSDGKFTIIGYWDGTKDYDPYQ